MTTNKTVDYDETYIPADEFKRHLGRSDKETLVSVTFNNLTQEVLVVTRNKENT